MTDTRHKNGNWTMKPNANNELSWEAIQVAVLMDIRDELQTVNRLLNCHRIPRALDAMYELGVEARRRKRLAAEKRRKPK
jgi:GTP cyclohydrolase III